jgi:hypothetical protein
MRYPSESRFLLMRNLAYGSAAVCLVTLLQIIQIGAKDPALEISVYGTAVGMPLWVAVGSCYEYYILLGQKSYLHFHVAANYLSGISIIAGISLLTAIGGAIYYIVPDAIYAFATVGVLALVITLAFANHIAHWWYGALGPEPDDADI